MNHNWLKRITAPLDNMILGPISGDRLVDSYSDFEKAFYLAQKTSSLAGELCKLSGAFAACIGLLLTVFSLATGSLYGFLEGLGLSLGLLIAGAPLIALGTIATQSKRQTALIALQTWHTPTLD